MNNLAPNKRSVHPATKYMMKTINVKTTNDDQTIIEGSQIEEFKQSARGKLIQPEDKGYDEADSQRSP